MTDDIASLRAAMTRLKLLYQVPMSSSTLVQSRLYQLIMREAVRRSRLQRSLS